MTSPRVLLALPRYRARLHALFPGIAFIAGALRAHGCEVAVYDEDVAHYAQTEGEKEAAKTLASLCENYKPTIAGVYVNTPNYREALRLAQELSVLTDAPLFAGGPHATLAGDAILCNHDIFSGIIGGEGEEVFPALAWALSDNRNMGEALSRIEGIATAMGIWLKPVNEFQDNLPLCSIGYREGKSIKRRWFHAPDLTRIALPDRRALLFPYMEELGNWAGQLYKQNFFHAIPAFYGKSVLTSHVSRGCPGKCPFCAAKAIFEGCSARRKRPMRHIKAELEDALDMGYEAWYFDEPSFPIADSSSWGVSLREILKRMGKPWGCVARLEDICRADMKKWQEAGLSYLYFGLETPHVGLQKNLGKSVEPARALNTSEALHDLGIQCDLSVFFGMPGETMETIGASLQWLNDNLPRGNVFFSLAAYWPGTSWSVQVGLNAGHWEPDYPHTEIANIAAWMPEDTQGIEPFFSNSTGTYHPAFLTVERALKIRGMIIESGLRERFAKYSRKRDSK